MDPEREGMRRGYEDQLTKDGAEEPMPQQRVQDLVAILHAFSSRLYGLRNSRKAREKALRDENCAQDQDESHP
jgi:predicted site-specific integrase-resolvase